MTDYAKGELGVEADTGYDRFRSLVDTKLDLIRQIHMVRPEEKAILRRNIDVLGDKILSYPNGEEHFRRYAREARIIG